MHTCVCTQTHTHTHTHTHSLTLTVGRGCEARVELGHLPHPRCVNRAIHRRGQLALIEQANARGGSLDGPRGGAHELQATNGISGGTQSGGRVVGGTITDYVAAPFRWPKRGCS